MNWLITGGCGFIGLRFVKYLLDETKDNIRILDNLSVGSMDELSSLTDPKQITCMDFDWDDRLSLIRGDIEDYNVVNKSVKGANYVVHLAANTGVMPSIEDPRADFMSNAMGTFNLLQASTTHKVDRFVFASSGAPLGEVDPPIHENLPTKPLSPYGASKLSGEAYCSAFYHSFGLNTVALRFGNVYGVGSKQKGSVVAKFIKEALNPEKTTWEIFGDGSQTRDFIYVDDLIEAILCAIETPDVGGEIFQIATSKETTVAEIAEALNEILNRHGYAKMHIENKRFRVGDARRNFSDTSKAKRRLGWSPSVDLPDGLDKTFRYFLEEGARNGR